MQQLATFMVNHWELFLALVIIVGLLSGTLLAGRMRGVRSISPAEAIQLINHDRAKILDVREENEYADGHILNSIHIPLASLEKRAAELQKYKKHPIIVSCRTGHRSNTACNTLKKQGHEIVFNLGGGILAWKNANFPVNK